jgi:lipid-A-disaccharide synthase
MRCVFLAVEASADLHAAALLKELQASGAFEFFAVGGPALEKAGAKLWENPLSRSEMGVASLSSLNYWRGLIQRSRQRLEELRPELIISVDSPDFNFRVVKGFKGRSHLVDYIAPQAWAWREKRRQIVGELYDQLLVIWPFEEDFFAPSKARVSFVGLPVIDHIEDDLNAQKAPEIPADSRGICLLPGSRPREIKLNLPVFIEVARRLLEEDPSLFFLLPRAPGLPEDLFSESARLGDRIKVCQGQSLACMKTSEMALAVNGTVTIEAMLLGLPHVAVYATTFFQKMIYRPLMKTKYFNMSNIILDREVVPEFMAENFHPEKIFEKTRALLSGGQEKQKEAFAKVREQLGGKGVAARAAQCVLRGLYA